MDWQPDSTGSDLGNSGIYPGSGYLEGFNLGGRIGQDITGQSAPIGILIIIGLIIVGLFFAIPRGFSHLLLKIFSLPFRRGSQESAAPAAPTPVIGPAFTPRTMPRINGEEPDLRTSAFPRFRPEPKPKPEVRF